jgi:hypothetical protein
MNFGDDLISLMPRADIRPVDDAFNEIFDRHKMARLGGASGRGWSSYATFQRCPYLYKVKYIDGERGVAAMALETGSIFHTFMALHYLWMLDENLTLTPQVCRAELMESGARPEAIIAGWRIYDAYALHYEQDYLYPLAIEDWAQGDRGNTCRYDMIARIDTPQPGITPGTWIIEHKSASRFTADLLEGWHNDGEILGQIMVWKQAKLDKKYGKLRGTIVNIVGKQKIPQFQRVIVPAQRWHVSDHDDDLRVWAALQEMYKATNTWPKARNNCVHRYGLCDLFQHCATHEKLTPLRRLEKAVKSARSANSEIASATESPLGLASDAEPRDTANGVSSTSTEDATTSTES